MGFLDYLRKNNREMFNIVKTKLVYYEENGRKGYYHVGFDNTDNRGRQSINEFHISEVSFLSSLFQKNDIILDNSSTDLIDNDVIYEIDNGIFRVLSKLDKDKLNRHCDSIFECDNVKLRPNSLKEFSMLLDSGRTVILNSELDNKTTGILSRFIEKEIRILKLINYDKSEYYIRVLHYNIGDYLCDDVVSNSGS